MLTSGLVGNTSAQSFTLAVQLVVALITVPIFAQQWGLEHYGIWLLLYTIPEYLALSDLGFTGASANAMTAAVARGDRNEAVQLYRELTGSTFLGSILLFAAIAAILLGPGSSWLDFAEAAAGGEATESVLALAAYALFMLLTRSLWSALRATGHFAKGTYVIGCAALAAVVLAGIAAVSGGGFLLTALGYMAGASIGLIWMFLLVRRYAPGFQPAVLPSSLQHLSPLAGPAIALIFAQLAQLLVLQGSVIALGAAAGAAAVPAFTALRTIARVGIQSVSVVSQAVTPELTMARARGDERRAGDLVALNLAAAIVLLIPGCALFLMLGRPILEIWSGGVISAPFALVAAIAAMLLFGGIWNPLTSFLAAENRQSSYAPAFLVLAIAGIGLAFGLSHHLGSVGAAIAMAAVDLLLAAWAFVQVKRYGFIRKGAILAAPKRAWTLMRGRESAD